MNDFLSLKEIVEKHNIKQKSLAVFGLDNLLKQAEHYSVSTPPEDHVGHMPEFVFPENDTSFCSIFSDQAESAMETQITQECSFNVKLVSEGTILSSEFEHEISDPVLTSDTLREGSFVS